MKSFKLFLLIFLIASEVISTSFLKKEPKKKVEKKQTEEKAEEDEPKKKKLTFEERMRSKNKWTPFKKEVIKPKEEQIGIKLGKECPGNYQITDPKLQCSKGLYCKYILKIDGFRCAPIGDIEQP